MLCRVRQRRRGDRGGASALGWEAWVTQSEPSHPQFFLEGAQAAKALA